MSDQPNSLLHDRTNIIIYGYSRHIEKSLLMPDDIKKIIISFVGDHFVYQGKYEWKIDKKSLNQLLVSPETRSTSKEFVISTSKWQLQALISGASFNLYLKLLSLFKDWKKVIIYQKLYCIETKSSYSCLRKYINGKIDGWPVYCLSLKEIQQRNLNELTIMAEVRILRMLKKEYNDFHVGKQLKFVAPIFYNKPFKKQVLEWKIDGELMKLMHTAYPGKRFESNVFNKIWCLRIAPNGMSMAWKDSFDIHLFLCSIPPNVEGINIKWTLRFKEMDGLIERSKRFSIDLCNDCWADNKILSFQEFKQYDILTVCVTVEILKLESNSGNELKEINWGEFVNQNK